MFIVEVSHGRDVFGPFETAGKAGEFLMEYDTEYAELLIDTDLDEALAMTASNIRELYHPKEALGDGTGRG